MQALIGAGNRGPFPASPHAHTHMYRSPPSRTERAFLILHMHHLNSAIHGARPEVVILARYRINQGAQPPLFPSYLGSRRLSLSRIVIASKLGGYALECML